MNLYAASTSVSIEKSKGELERLLVKHGATRYGIAHHEEGAQVSFILSGHHVCVSVPLPPPAAYPNPDPTQDDYSNKAKTPRDWNRWNVNQRKRWIEEQRNRIDAQRDQASRQRWRCILLIVRAKLELIEMKLSTVEREFLADITLNDGRTVLEAMAGKLLTA